MHKRIHIVSFDVPYPADYGGVIDVYSRLKWFSEMGWTVILHCFHYKRPPAKALEKYAEVHYYDRPLGLRYWFAKRPYIVQTRMHSQLEKVLAQTNDCVLLEGLHCAHYLHLQPGKFYVRTHNIEHDYYQKLAGSASWIKRMFYLSEAKKLKQYESTLAQAKALLVIAESEMEHFLQLNERCFFVPPIIELNKQFKTTEPYVLFQGNLSVEENEEAVNWILATLSSQLNHIQLVIAGKNPSNALVENCKRHQVELVANPMDEEMDKWLGGARVHLLWTNNSSGVKLKFLKAMACSGHVICSQEMVEGSGLTNGFHLIESPAQTQQLVTDLLAKELTEKEWLRRVQELHAFSGVQKLTEIFS